jgi:hypothetical protein
VCGGLASDAGGGGVERALERCEGAGVGVSEQETEGRRDAVRAGATKRRTPTVKRSPKEKMQVMVDGA